MKIRNQEITMRSRSYGFELLNYVISVSTDSLIILVTLICYFQLGNKLSPSIVLPSLAYMSLTPTMAHINTAITTLFFNRDGLKVIEDFLSAEERPSSEPIHTESDPIVFDRPVWEYKEDDNESNNFKLSVAEFVIPKGSFIGLAGKVGSGKSTLLKGLLNQVTLVSGKVKYGSDDSILSKARFPTAPKRLGL